MVVLWQSSCIRAKVVFIWTKLFLFGQKFFYFGEWFCLGKSGCIRAKWLYSDKVVVFEQK